ncbi:MAG: tyrosine-type recombinase/integrase [Clostridia bacterium]|nr:tyrosine-type recombinase/integrase [Clostridia bacterium]
MSDYSEQFNIKQTEKLRELCRSLPECAFEFFRGIENRTSALTRVGYARDLKLFFTYLTENIGRFMDKEIVDFTIKDLSTVTPTEIEMFLEYLSFYKDENGKKCVNSASGKNRKLACLRSFYKYFFKKEKIENNPAAIVDMAKLHEKPIIRLDVNEVADLLDNVESGETLSKREKGFHDAKTAKRDLAIITLFLSTGIRISELVGLDITDFDFENNSFLITRKGGKQSVLFFGKETKDALLEYLEQRKQIEALNEEDKNAFFLSLQKRRIGVRAVQKLVKKYAVGTTPLKKISPHKLRSTFGTMLYNETGDIYLVADVLGHKNVNTTQKHYAAQDEANRRYASKQIKLREKDKE